jgi:hypothetical protein
MWRNIKYFFQDFSYVGDMIFYINDEFSITNSVSFLDKTYMNYRLNITQFTRHSEHFLTYINMTNKI